MGALLTPALGTVVWASIAFLVVLFVLRRFAWGPILTALNDREASIAGALSEAEKVRKEMEALSASNESQLKEARAERDSMLREAREMADKLVSDAKNTAREAADKEVAAAKDAIALERKAAIAELKSEVGNISLDIAERLLRDKLESNDEQKALVNRLIDESPLN
jgi:F-type H+-transporting ATPase subunit b